MSGSRRPLQDRVAPQRHRRCRRTVKLLPDEMYPPALAKALRAAGIETATAGDLQLRGSTDQEVFTAAITGGYAVLTGNVGDFIRIAADHSTSGGPHHGLLIALSSPRRLLGGV